MPSQLDSYVPAAGAVAVNLSADQIQIAEVSGHSEPRLNPKLGASCLGIGMFEGQRQTGHRKRNRSRLIVLAGIAP